MRRIRVRAVLWAVALALMGCAHQKESDLTPEKILSSLDAKLNSVILTNVEMQNVPLDAAARYLTEQSRRADPDHVGVTIEYRTFQINEFPRRVTMNMAQATVLQALEELCRQTRCNYLIEKDQVIVVPRDLSRPQSPPMHIFGP